MLLPGGEICGGHWSEHSLMFLSYCLSKSLRKCKETGSSTSQMPPSAVPDRSSDPRSGLSPGEGVMEINPPALMAVPNSRWCKRKQSRQHRLAFFLDDDEVKPTSCWLLPCVVSSPGERRGPVAEGWAVDVGRSLEEGEPGRQEGCARGDVLNSLQAGWGRRPKHESAAED